MFHVWIKRHISISSSAWFDFPHSYAWKSVLPASFSLSELTVISLQPEGILRTHLVQLYGCKESLTLFNHFILSFIVFNFSPHLTSARPSRGGVAKTAARSSRTQDLMLPPSLRSRKRPAGHLAQRGPIPRLHRLSSQCVVRWPPAQSTHC